MPQLPESFGETEPLFWSVICGCDAGLYREALHEVYIPRIQRGNAYFAADVLGARRALLSVLIHFFEDGWWGAPLAKGVRTQTLTPEDQLFILIQAGLCLTTTRGFASPEARICYERAEPLCRSLNRPRLLNLTLIGQWRYSLVEIWRSGGVQLVEEIMESPVVCLAYQAMSEWCLGESASYQTTKAESISLAKERNDANALVTALYFATLTAGLERNLAEVERFASELVELSVLRLSTSLHQIPWKISPKITWKVTATRQLKPNRYRGMPG